MRARALVLLPVLAALPLGGCVVAAVPVVAGAIMARSEAQRSKRQPAPVSSPAPATIVTVGAVGTAATSVISEFEPLIAHVRSRATLWREGAPIKSLVLDNKQTVLNPVAIDCQRRQPVVLVDLDPAATGTDTLLDATLAANGWSSALAAIRDLDVGIIWITGRADSEANAVRARLNATGLDPMSRDAVAGTPQAAVRKQDIRLEQARSHCVLAVVGDKRGDADEAYDYLRSPDAKLPIDDNWGIGWFLLPAPLRSQ